MEISKNNRAGEIMGYRNNDGMVIAIDLPRELGYVCPICKKKGETLQWSEYNGFLYCSNCNVDIPSCLCMPDIPKAIDIFLDTVQECTPKRR